MSFLDVLSKHISAEDKLLYFILITQCRDGIFYLQRRERSIIHENNQKVNITLLQLEDMRVLLKCLRNLWHLDTTTHKYVAGAEDKSIFYALEMRFLNTVTKVANYRWVQNGYSIFQGSQLSEWNAWLIGITPLEFKKKVILQLQSLAKFSQFSIKELKK